jgi:hypothetical protein
MSGGLGFSKSSSQQFVDPAQAPFLQQLRQGGQNLQQGLQGQFQGLGQLGAGLGGQAGGFVNQLGQAGQGLNQFIGSGPVNQQIEGLTGAAQNFIDKNLNQISGQSNLAGQFGGGRGQVAQGAAIGEAGAQLGLGIGDILGQDFFRQQQAAGLQGQLQNQGNLGGLAGLSNIFDLFQSGLLGQFGGLQSQQGLVGGPTVLGQSKSLSAQAQGGI